MDRIGWVDRYRYRVFGPSFPSGIVSKVSDFCEAGEMFVKIMRVGNLKSSCAGREGFL